MWGFLVALVCVTWLSLPKCELTKPKQNGTFPSTNQIQGNKNVIWCSAHYPKVFSFAQLIQSLLFLSGFLHQEADPNGQKQPALCLLKVLYLNAGCSMPGCLSGKSCQRNCICHPKAKQSFRMLFSVLISHPPQIW